MNVLITGASQGLGAALAREFARHDCAVLLTARRGSQLRDIAAQCGSRAEVHACDVTDPAQVAHLARAAGEIFGGPPDLIVNNAGAWMAQPALEATLPDLDAMLNSNLRSAFLVSRAFLPGLVARRSGSLVFIASIAALRGLPGNSLYCAAKAGLLGYARALREELKPAGVRVLIALPGATLTPAWDGSGVPPERLMAADSVARAVVANALLPADCVAEEFTLRPQLGDL